MLRLAHEGSTLGSQPPPQNRRSVHKAGFLFRQFQTGPPDHGTISNDTQGAMRLGTQCVLVPKTYCPTRRQLLPASRAVLAARRPHIQRDSEFSVVELHAVNRRRFLGHRADGNDAGRRGLCPADRRDFQDVVGKRRAECHQDGTGRRSLPGLWYWPPATNDPVPGRLMTEGLPAAASLQGHPSKATLRRCGLRRSGGIPSRNRRSACRSA